MAIKEFKGKEGTYGDSRSEKKSFDPMSIDGMTPRCVCGYELIKETEDTFRCAGGGHRYRMSEGEVEFDKFGNVLLKMPEDNKNGKSNKKA